MNHPRAPRDNLSTTNPEPRSPGPIRPSEGRPWRTGRSGGSYQSAGTGELGDEHEVVAGAHQPRHEGEAQHVRRHRHADACGDQRPARTCEEEARPTDHAAQDENGQPRCLPRLTTGALDVHPSRATPTRSTASVYENGPAPDARACSRPTRSANNSLREAEAVTDVENTAHFEQLEPRRRGGACCRNPEKRLSRWNALGSTEA